MKRLSYILRELFKFKGSTFTKLVSLTIGLAIGGLAFSYCAFEMTYDDFHRDTDRIFRIASMENHENIKAALLTGVDRDIPEIEESTCTFQSVSNYESGSHVYYENTVYADTSFFRLFSFRTLSGVPSYELNYADRLFISQRFAHMLFGDTDPLGKQLKSNGKLWTVAGVFETIPRNCHLLFEVIRPMKALEEETDKGWNGTKSFSGYIRLSPGTNLQAVCEKIQAIADKNDKAEYNDTYLLQPLQDLHLKYGLGYSYVILVGVLGLIIVLVSTLNYILIAVSSLVQKAKEIGIHKVNGASTTDIFNMFLVETVVLIAIAGVFTMGLVLIFRPFLEYLMYIDYADLFTFRIMAVIAGFVSLMILLTGVIPARLFSSVSVLQIFRQVVAGRRSWKHALLWAQFTSACFLVTLLIIFNGQFSLMMSKDLGYNMDRLYFTTMQCGGEHPSLASVKSEIERLPYVSGASFTNTIPLWAGGTTIYNPEGKGVMECRLLETDEDFFRIFEIPMTEEDNLHKASQDKNSVVINEKLKTKLKKLEGDNQEFVQDNRPLNINGVCRNFQVLSLYASQQPLVVRSLEEPDSARSLSLVMRLSSATPENLKTIQLKLREISGEPNLFLRNYRAQYEGGYEGEKDMCTTVRLFSLLTIIMVILGLFGFTGDEVARRTKEIAIRKINGASVGSITILLLRSIFLLALFSLPFALIGAYYMGSFWLDEFAYQLPLTLWIFATGATITFAIILFTVLLKSHHGIHMPPVKALKSE